MKKELNFISLESSNKVIFYLLEKNPALNSHDSLNRKI